MVKRIEALRQKLFAGPEPAAGVRHWLLVAGRFCFLVTQEFSRNRCPEKASALGFQTVFSLIPAIVLALYFAGSANLRPAVTEFLFQVLNLEADEGVSSPAPGQPLEPPAGAGPQPTPAESKAIAEQQRRWPVRQPSPNQPAAAGAPAAAGTTGGPAPPAGGQGEAAAQPPAPAAGQTGLKPSADRADRSILMIRQNIESLVDTVYGKLVGGGLNVVSVAWLICAALMLALTLENSLDEIWGVPGGRRFIRRIAIYWSVFTLGPLLIGFSSYASQRMSSGLVGGPQLRYLAVEVLGPLLAFYVMYQLMPAGPVRPLPALGGALAGAILWKCAGTLFRIYLTRAVGYDKFYGTLGLIPVFLFWVWILWTIVLVGAEITYAIQNYDRLATEERRRLGAPFVRPGLVALGLVLHAARSFAGGKGPVDADVVARYVGMPDNLWQRLVRLLIDRGILVRAGRDSRGIAPKRPLEDIRVQEVLEAVEDTFVLRSFSDRHPERRALQKLAEALNMARQRELGAMTVADLLRMEEATAPEQPQEPAPAATTSQPGP